MKNNVQNSEPSQSAEAQETSLTRRSSNGRGTLVQASFEGPLPPPQVLAEYDRLLPGAANRIISMAEEQAKHRQSLEQKVVESNIVLERRGMNYAFCLTLVVIVMAIWLIAIGKDVAGITTLVATLLFHVGSRIYAGYNSDQDQED